MTTDSRPLSQEFVVWTERGKFAFVCEDLYDGRWRMEWRAHNGEVLYSVPWSFQDTPDLHLQIRDAHRLEYPDLDPDFVSLAERHAISGGSIGATDPKEIELVWIFYAIGRALKRESPGDDEFLSGIAEASATFLEERAPHWRLAHPKRRRRGKPTDRFWAMLTKPVQEEMEAFVVALVPELAKTINDRRESISAVENYLREAHAGPLHQFSKRMIERLIYLAGFSLTELPSELQGQATWSTTREHAYMKVFEGRVLNRLASLIYSLPGTLPVADLSAALQLDSSDSRSVQWVLHQGLAVLFGSAEARSMLRSFRLPRSKH